MKLQRHGCSYQSTARVPVFGRTEPLFKIRLLWQRMYTKRKIWVQCGILFVGEKLLDNADVRKENSIPCLYKYNSQAESCGFIQVWTFLVNITSLVGNICIERTWTKNRWQKPFLKSYDKWHEHHFSIDTETLLISNISAHRMVVNKATISPSDYELFSSALQIITWWGGRVLPLVFSLF